MKRAAQWTTPALPISTLILLMTMSSFITCIEGVCVSYRSFDGYCNNYDNPTLGMGGQLMYRGPEGSEYLDDVAEPVRYPVRPNERVISNKILASLGGPVYDNKMLNLMGVFFGQFMSHDIGMNARNETTDAVFSTPDNDTDAVIIPIIEPDDPLPPTVRVAARKYRIRTLKSLGEIHNGKFEIRSDATPFLDLGPLYGTTKTHSDALRTFSGGKLKTRDYVDAYSSNFNVNVTSTVLNWLPLINDTGVNTSRVVDLNQPDDKCFSTGDPRANENIALLVIHGAFLRFHNKLATKLSVENPDWNDDQLFMRARDITIAIYQHIVMDEYLPTILGPYTTRIGKYKGYDETVDPRVSVAFSSAAFRFGHSALPTVLELKDKCNEPPFSGPDAVRNTRRGAGQNGGPTSGYDLLIQTGKPENVLHGVLYSKALKVDATIEDSLRNIAAVPFDVVAVNILRGRLNGVPNYDKIRSIYSKDGSVYDHPLCNTSMDEVDSIECFKLVTGNVEIAQKLLNVYGKVNRLDAFVGFLAERRYVSVVGPTAAAITVDQFRRLRDGDRWWYQNADNGLLRPGLVNWIREHTNMRYVLKEAYPEAHIPEFAFYVPLDEDSFFRDCYYQF